MQFLYPSFLWALLAIAIPIIIHLFYFRRFKKVYFTNVRFLKEIKEETSNRSKLKNLLVLISRILAVSALVFAFAQPFIPKNDQVKSGNSAVSIFVDNSFSMTSTKDEIPLLDYAKEKAISIVEAYSDEDRFQILTHDFEGKHQRLVTKEDARTYIEEIYFTPFVQDMQKILNRQKQLLESSESNKISYIISDFQKSIIPTEAWKDTLIEINLIPVQSIQENNVSIDSVWFEGPVPLKNQSNNLIVRVKNNGTAIVEQMRLSFTIEGQEKPVGISDIPPAGYKTDTIKVMINTSGWQSAMVSITDFPVQFDDKYYISFLVPDTIKALSVNDAGINRYMNALFSGISYFSLTNQQISQLQYQRFPEYDLIILNDLRSISSGLSAELTSYIRNGGKVLVFPGQNAELNSYNQFLNQNSANSISGPISMRKEVSGINTSEFIFEDVYINQGPNLKLPVTQLAYIINRSQSRGEEQLLIYRDGTPFLTKYIQGDGQLFLCSGPLDADKNDLVTHAEVFVPMLYKMALSRSKKQNISHTITNKIIIETDNKRKTGDYVYTLKGKEEFIPGQNTSGSKIILDLGNNIRESGVYDLLLDENIVGKFAFNYDRKESDLSMYAETELEKMISDNPKINLINAVLQANISTTISNKDKGILLWRYFLIGALIFLALEILLLRFWKT